MFGDPPALAPPKAWPPRLAGIAEKSVQGIEMSAWETKLGNYALDKQGLRAA